MPAIAGYARCRPLVSRPKVAATSPPAAITIATNEIDHVVLPVASLRWPKMYGPAIAAALPTPSIRPKALERSRVGNDSDVYGYTAPHAPRLKKPTKTSAVTYTAWESAAANA